MLQQFVESLADNAADVLTVAVVLSVVAGLVLFWLRRRRHIADIRRRLLGGVEVPGKAREMLAKALNADVAEMSAIGAVSLVDLAWHYGMADPTIWDAFDGPAADHMADAMQNLDVLKGALGDHGLLVVHNIFEYLRSLEATQVFGDLIDKLPLLDNASTVVLEAKGASVVDSLASGAASTDAVVSAKADAVGNAGLVAHIPLVTVGFASYRAWRRAQKGAGLRRNVEFAGIEVATRASGGLVGGKVGGVVGSLIVPGVGTVIGTVAGAVAGAVGGALLGETFKKRHVERASGELNTTLTRLGMEYLDHRGNFQRVTDLFREQEQEYVANLRETRRRLRRYSMPWRLIWPDEKLILLRETVAMAEDRLGSIQEGTVEAIDRLNFMRNTGQRRELGIMLWSNPALCEELDCNSELVGAVQQANDQLRHELAQLGALPKEGTELVSPAGA